ncbi:MAG: tetratricopeptide repeat protein, partial [Gammaproteobacteria bacterium]|nr:tetratricopeptide repeat protein [Gammaproteobacteria bacterium]
MSSTGYQTRKHQQYRTAFEYYEQGDLIAAKSRFQKLSRKFPSDVVIWSVLGAIHSQLGDHDKSIMAYKRALAITPKNPKLRTEFANSLYLGGQSNQAETELIKA